MTPTGRPHQNIALGIPTTAYPAGTEWADKPVDGSVEASTFRSPTLARMSGKGIARQISVPLVGAQTSISRCTGPQEITRTGSDESSKSTVERAEDWSRKKAASARAVR